MSWLSIFEYKYEKKSQPSCMMNDTQILVLDVEITFHLLCIIPVNRKTDSVTERKFTQV